MAAIDITRAAIAPVAQAKATVCRTRYPGTKGRTLKGVDPDDPVLREIPRFDFPTFVSQHYRAGSDGLECVVEATDEDGEIVWTFAYSLLSQGDPA